VRYNLAPAIRGAAIPRDKAGQAIDALAAPLPYETGQTSQNVAFAHYPIYLRGEAYLANKQGPAATAEVSEDSRPSRIGRKRTHRRVGAPRTRPGICEGSRSEQSQSSLCRLSRPLENCRS
jgi:hypothetical protein